MAYQAIGQAIIKAITTHFIKSLLSMVSISDILASFTLRMPISFRDDLKKVQVFFCIFVTKSKGFINEKLDEPY